MNGWHLKLSFLIGNVLSVLYRAQPIAAQVIPDNTLPVAEQTQVSGNPNFQIDGGVRRGGNLFHSFQQFSVPTGGSAYFNNAADIQNILTRVTGGSISNIDGLIRTNGKANLFLLNPNGIVFGLNGSLNIGGSFVAATANAIGLDNGEVFSSNATQPLPSQLLNVNPNALFFNQLAAQAIINRSTANNNTGLQVPSGQSLLLVGGDVRLEGGQIISPGSRVELGAVAGQGKVGLSRTAFDWRLSFPDSVARADVSLNNNAGINVRAAAGGSIAITAGNLSLSEGSSLFAGINDGLGLAGAQAGDIQLDATETINLADSSAIRNDVRFGGTGNAGNINITTGSLSLTNGAQVNSFTQGKGNTGSVNVNARDTVFVDGYNSTFGNSSGIRNTVGPDGIGNTGDINITTGSLALTNGAQVNSFTQGKGNTGSVNVNARDTIFVDGYNSTFGNSSGIRNTVSLGGKGNTGGINITTGSLYLTKSAQLISGVAGQGNAGDVNIVARDRISFDGYTSGGYGTALFNNVQPTGVGNAGNIYITTGSFFFTNGAQLISITRGRGNAGSVTINARDIVSLDGSAGSSPILGLDSNDAAPSTISTQVSPGSEGQGGDITITTGSLALTNGGILSTENAGGIGNAGRVTINARDSVQIRGAAPISNFVSGVFTKLSPQGAGRGGDIDISARSLSLINNAQLSAATSGAGSAGNITVSADTVGLSGGGQLLTTTDSSGRAGDIIVKTPDLQLRGASSGLFAETTSTGDAGNLTIQPRGNGQNVRVNLQSGAQISASTKSSGQGGLLTIAAPESITLTGDGSIIAAGTGSSGAGGNLKLQTGTLGIQNQAEVTVSSSSTGSAGNLFVDANQIYLNNSGRIRADTTGGGGNINLRSPLILLRNGSNITTNARGSNVPGGNIAIDTKFLIAAVNEDSNISANSQDFRGGNVSINAFSLFGIQPRLIPTRLSDITATGATFALSGTLDVTTARLDPTAGLVELPIEFVDRSRLIATGCPAKEGNSFVITGRGGLPPTPEQQLDDDADWQDRRRLTVASLPQNSSSENPLPARSSPPQSQQSSSTVLVEATGWYTTPTGEILLVADTSKLAVQYPLNQLGICKGKS